VAGKRSEVQVKITGDADLGQAVKEVQRDFAKMERASEATVREIEQAFAGADLEVELDKGALTKAARDFDAFAAKLGADGVDVAVDLTDLRRAFDLADQLDAITASIDIDTDLSDLQQAEALARNLRSFTGRIGLDVEGTNELREALGLAENLDQLRQVKIDVQGRQDLERAEAIARDLDGTTVNVDVKVDESDLAGFSGRFREAGSEAAGAFSGGFDPNELGDNVAEGMLGAIGSAGPWAVAAVAIGSAFADDFSAGFSRGFAGSARSDLVLQLRGDLSGPEMEAVGRAGAAAYGEGFGESLAGVKETAALIEQELGDIDPQLDLTEATRQAESLALVFGVDVAESIRSVDSLVSRGLVPNTETGFNLLADLGKQTGQEFDEVLEVTNEFGAALTALGIDGPQGLFLIGEALRSDVYAQADQAGEVFEEFNEIVSNGQAAEAIEAIGLNAAEMQDAVADGRGAEAMAVLARALLEVEDGGTRTALAVEIFGGNINRATDKQYALELLAQADGFREVDGGASGAADSIAATQTEWDKFSKSIEEGSSAIGNALAIGFNRVKEFGESFPGIGESAEGNAAELAAMEIKLGSTSEALVKTGEAGADAAGLLGDTTDAVIDLDDALSAFSGRFDADQVFRSIEEDALAAVEAMTGLTSASFDLNDGFDITTEAGRKAEAAMEGLSGNLDDLIEGYRDSTVSAPEFVAGQAEIEASIREAAAAAGLSEAATQRLIDKYGDVPADITTDIGIVDNATNPLLSVRDRLNEITGRKPKIEIDDQATNPLRSIKDRLNEITSKTVTVTTVQRSTVNPDRRASGGPVQAGRQYLVGERGPELVVFPDDGYVLDAQATARIQSAADTDPARVLAPVASASAGPGRVVNFNGPIVTPPGRDLWEQLRHTELIYAEL
jgi:hypothetical protein